ncbi:unnamed protein product [Didymodactylos carnosus]|uniref:F-box domain-containing protein n=1 Tax=Didymodactylos carnosus TaxID=1234261 RepID=A0A8S2J9N0_9BILA|nr:unnamed protein product [Didymodactylos carnosus]CAF3801100.1 unnamed protein product [Didymodactylos carnosus]
MADNSAMLCQMPTETILLIFDRLPAIDVLYSFFGVNKRYHQIIQRYVQNIDLRNADEHVCEYCCITLLPTIRLHIKRLVLDNFKTFEKILSNRSKSITRLFPCLKHFEIVESFNTDQLLIDYLQSFRLLLSLKITMIGVINSNQMCDEIFLCEGILEKGPHITMISDKKCWSEARPLRSSSTNTKNSGALPIDYDKPSSIS